MTKISQITAKMMSSLTPRQKEFLEERFGLVDAKKKTLQELGERHGITRERVRQIEAEALKLAAKNFEKSGGVELVKIAENHLDLLGGVRKEDQFVNDLKYLFKDNNITQHQARFLFEVAKYPLYHSDDDNHYSFWYSNKQNLKKAAAFISKTEKFLNSKKVQFSLANQADQYFTQLAKSSGLKEGEALNLLTVSKKFAINPYNDFGLVDWEEINPKTARSKAYLVLKKHGKPLHFRQIAEMINKAGFDNKPVYAQTIHNELIKDKRFVLVGRGTYALKEHGYIPGTAKEIINNILKSKGPLYPKDLVELVSEQRLLKENTILLNLQNKKNFKKLSDGRYHIA